MEENSTVSWLGIEGLRDFHHQLNQLSPAISLSLDHSGDTPAIPFLDTTICIAPDGSIVSEFYTKPTHSGVLLHYTSAHPHSTKEAIATSEIRRATAVANTQKGVERGIKKVTSRLEGNGYPMDVLQRAHRRARGRHRACRQRDQPDGVLVLPFISTATTHQVRKAVRRSGLNIRIAHRSGPTLRSILTKSPLEPPTCPGHTNCLACQAGLQGRCTAKNAVYRLNCVLCPMEYIGETKRPIRERMMEHRRAARNRDA